MYHRRVIDSHFNIEDFDIYFIFLTTNATLYGYIKNKKKNVIIMKNETKLESLVHLKKLRVMYHEVYNNGLPHLEFSLASCASLSSGSNKITFFVLDGGNSRRGESGNFDASAVGICVKVLFRCC